jgi:ribosomal protein S14
MWCNVNWNQRYMWGSDSNKISKVTSDAVVKKNTKKYKKKKHLRTDGQPKTIVRNLTISRIFF